MDAVHFDVRAQMQDPAVNALAQEFGVTVPNVARMWVTVMDGFAHKRRRVAGILDRGDFAVAPSREEVVNEVRRQLRALEYPAQYSAPNAVTWIEQDRVPPSSRSATYSLDSRLDIDLVALAQAQNGNSNSQ